MFGLHFDQPFGTTAHSPCMLVQVYREKIMAKVKALSNDSKMRDSVLKSLLCKDYGYA